MRERGVCRERCRERGGGGEGVREVSPSKGQKAFRRGRGHGVL